MIDHRAWQAAVISNTEQNPVVEKRIKRAATLANCLGDEDVASHLMDSGLSADDAFMASKAGALLLKYRSEEV